MQRQFAPWRFTRSLDRKTPSACSELRFRKKSCYAMRLALMTIPRKVCTLLDVSRQWSSDCENTTVFGERGLQSRPWLDEQLCPIVGSSTFPRTSRKSACPTRGKARACLEKTTHLLCEYSFVKTKSFRTGHGSIHILRRTKALMQPTSTAYTKIVQNTVMYKPTLAKRTQTQIASRGAAPLGKIGNSWLRQRRHTKKCVS